MTREEKEIRLADLVLAKAMWPYIRPYAWMLAVSTLLVFAGIFFELSIPLLIQKGLDGFILQSGQNSKDALFLVSRPKNSAMYSGNLNSMQLPAYFV
jgi:ATP-binding cassette subfamily B protein